MRSRFTGKLFFFLLAFAATLLPSTAQQQPAGPPPSVANEPPPEPGADELNTAARKGDVVAVRALLDRGISPDAKWRYGMTALFPACDRGFTEVVRLLLDRGANVNVTDRFYNASPIVWALNKSHADVVALLLAKGAPNSDRVLLLGVEKKHADLVRASVAKGGLQSYALTAALLRATREGKPEIAQILQEGGAKMPPSVPESDLASYVGSYTSPNDPDPLVLQIKSGALEATSGNQIFQLFADGDGFRPTEFPGMVVKFVKEGDKVTTLNLIQGTRTTPYKKAEVKP